MVRELEISGNQIRAEDLSIIEATPSVQKLRIEGKDFSVAVTGKQQRGQSCSISGFELEAKNVETL